MKYTYWDAIEIGVFAACAIITLIILVIKALPANRGRYSIESAIFSVCFFIFDMAMLSIKLLGY